MDERILVVNADDFGLTPGVCTGILRSHREGIVTSTSILATATAFGRFAPALADSGMGVGAHLAAVGEERPALTAREIPTLVDRRGRFPLTWHQFVLRSMQTRIDPKDVLSEFRTQLEIVTAAGLRPEHVDSHQHLHLWPPVGRVVTDLAQRFAIPAIRVPETQKFSAMSPGVMSLTAWLRRRARRAGLSYPATSVGLDQSGHMDTRRLISTLVRLADRPTRTAELLVHPGSAEDPCRTRYRWGYAWAAEEAALCNPTVRSVVDRLGFTLGTYADLVAPER